MKKLLPKLKQRLIRVKPKHFFKRKEKASSVGKIKKKKSFQFPRIFRSFTEKYFLASLISFALILIIIIVGLDLYKDIKEKQKNDKERQEIIKELQFWEAVVGKYKDYRDAYFQLALLEYRLGDFNESNFYLEKALSLDPNFKEGIRLVEILRKFDK